MWSRTPILMLTALASTDDQVAGLEAGADAYMSKPFDLREMERTRPRRWSAPRAASANRNPDCR